MPQCIRRWLRRGLWLALVASFGLVEAGRGSADTILFTASTDNTGGLNPVSVPNANNPFIPSISPGVTLTPNPALLDSNLVGPLNGILYGPFGFGGNEGGTTGFVHVSFTLPALPAGATGFRLVWEVSDVIDHSRVSALAIDNVRLGNTLLFGFDSGIPAGFTALGTVGTSGPITGLSPTQGTAFAFLDTTGNIPPIYDTVDGTFGSRLFSSGFSATAGTVLSLDVAFLTNDGGPFHDYGIVALQAIPEPASVRLLASGVACLAGFAYRRRRGRTSDCRPTSGGIAGDGWIG
jgi:hypothetical protein